MFKQGALLLLGLQPEAGMIDLEDTRWYLNLLIPCLYIALSGLPNSPTELVSLPAG